MRSYQIKSLSATVTHICDPTGVASFLVQGETGAVLIDTGVGMKGLAPVVRKETSLPLTVVLTHGHPDHAGGASLFEKIYLHQRDWPMAAHPGSLKMRMEYAHASMPPGTVIDEKDFAPVMASGFLPLEDGQLFDLGGITLEAILVPGHTQGSMCILFRQERAMLFGDACNVNTLLLFDDNSCTVSEYRQSLLRLQKRDSEYDTAYFSHGPAIGPRQCLADNIELCDRIMAGTDDAVPFNFMGKQAWRAAAADEYYRRLDGKFGNIVYRKDRI